MPEPLDLDVAWNVGAKSRKGSNAPLIQVHHASKSTIILRQSLAVSYEGPFLYLLFGTDRALLLDTGATTDPSQFPLREIVDGLVSEWLADHPHPNYELVVAHSHAHQDHISADGQFFDRDSTTVVGHGPKAVADFFSLPNWPESSAHFNLGDRQLTVIAIPGHHPSSIAIYDAQSESLFTGDTIYPGRLYVNNFSDFAASVDRLVLFAQNHHVAQLLGAHIEMSTTARQDFPLGSSWHPREAGLPMSTAQLFAIKAAIETSCTPGAYRFDDFAIWNGVPKAELAKQVMRLFAFRLFGRT